MDLSAIIEVVIGLIFMWITLSLATIQIQEWILTMLDKRAQDMEKSLHEMLANPNLRSQFYDHPIIRGLTARKRKRPSPVPTWFYRYPIVRGFTKEKRRLPSYIPSANFSLALFDIVMTAGTESSLIQQGILKIREDFERQRNKSEDQAVVDALNILSDMARSAAASEAGTAVTNYSLELLREKVQQMSQQYQEKYRSQSAGEKDERLKQVADALDKALREARVIANTELQELRRAVERAKAEAAKKDTGRTPLDPVLDTLKRGVADLSVISPELNQTLNSLMFNVEEYASEKERQLAKARQSVEGWFNNSMDRVSGVFKRYTQAMALILGLVLSSLLNVDSISLAQYLWREPTVRQILVVQAANLQPVDEQAQANPQETFQQLSQQFAGLNLPIGWDLKNYGAPALFNNNCQLFPRTGQYFGIPLFGSNLCVTQPHTTEQENLAIKIFGILITAGATAQGAPFWFDLLKKVVNLRSTGPNPAEKGAGK